MKVLITVLFVLLSSSISVARENKNALPDSLVEAGFYKHNPGDAYMYRKGDRSHRYYFLPDNYIVTYNESFDHPKLRIVPALSSIDIIPVASRKSAVPHILEADSAKAWQGLVFLAKVDFGELTYHIEDIIGRFGKKELTCLMDGAEDKRILESIGVFYSLGMLDIIESRVRRAAYDNIGWKFLYYASIEITRYDWAREVTYISTMDESVKYGTMLNGTGLMCQFPELRPAVKNSILLACAREYGVGLYKALSGEFKNRDLALKMPYQYIEPSFIDTLVLITIKNEPKGILKARFEEKIDLGWVPNLQKRMEQAYFFVRDNYPKDFIIYAPHFLSIGWHPEEGVQKAMEALVKKNARALFDIEVIKALRSFPDTHTYAHKTLDALLRVE